jgi:hypothetical protein
LHSHPGAFEEKTYFQLIGNAYTAMHLHGFVGDQLVDVIEASFGQAGQLAGIGTFFINRTECI